ncbi:uncharacterized protein LOC141808677 [Halichoeres trimaculatus]|uniref:uncharacterized protein LOC141808677 n=1 Tax=Halichoeres trimaculatus TaxID=147232 RepID=UPI003D9E9A4E
MLKKVMCFVTLSMINTSSSSHVSQSVVTYCKSNETAFEATLNMLDRVLSELIKTKPDDMATIAGMGIVVLDQLQNQTSLWESLLALPEVFSSGSVDKMIDSTESLISSIQSAMQTIQNKFPEAGAPFSMLEPVFSVGLKIIHHAQKWPGPDVSIPLKKVVILHNDTLSQIVREALPQIEIPLRKAIALTMDRKMVLMYLCNNTNNPMWLSAACTTKTVDMLLDWISPDKVAQQALLAWSKHVAPHDVAFVKELLQSLMGESSPGGQGGPHNTRTRRSVETQPQNIEEELFLALGEVVLDIIKIWPGADVLVQNVLGSSLQSMKMALLTLETVDELIGNVLKDADQLKKTFLMLMTDQDKASMWFSRVLDSVMEVIIKVLESDSLTCEDVLEPFDWLLNIETVQIQGFTSLICKNGSNLQHAVLKVLVPLIESAEDFNSTILSATVIKVPISVILSTWQKMFNNSVQFIELVGTLAEELGGAYWMNWMPDNSTDNVTETLQQSAFLFMVRLGETIEKSNLWPEVKDYVHMVNWVLMYKPGEPAPHNCSVN